MVETQTPWLEVDHLSVRRDGRLILDEIDFSLSPGQQLAIVGQTGSGKTTLIEALAGRIFHQGKVLFSTVHGQKPRVQVIERQHRFANLSNVHSFYYQQRFNSFDAEDARTVMEELQRTGAGKEQVLAALEQVGMGQLAETRLIQLSNGEHKRCQLAEALLMRADWILLDCPFTGLDKMARTLLHDILDRLSTNGTKYLLITTPDDIPQSATHVAVLENGRLQQPIPRDAYLHLYIDQVPTMALMPDPDRLAGIPLAYPETPFAIAVKMVCVNIRYEGRNILNDVHWEVHKGECWHLAGPNGSGKSTLLSLINGDNPQAFSQEICLFDRKKGSGESIWDIKRNIGFVSPELHHYFEGGSNAFNLVASGLFDTMGLFRKLNDFQAGLVRQWMDILHIGHLSQQIFQRLSDGEQRLVLLARALVKNPPLLILDEPCQGLDAAETREFTALVDQLCRHLGKTLIYVSHYDTELPDCISRRIELHNGRVVYQGALA